MCAIDHSGVSTGAFFLLSAFLSPPFQSSCPLTLDLSVHLAPLARAPGALFLLVPLVVTWPQGALG